MKLNIMSRKLTRKVYIKFINSENILGVVVVCGIGFGIAVFPGVGAAGVAEAPFATQHTSDPSVLQSCLPLLTSFV